MLFLITSSEMVLKLLQEGPQLLLAPQDASRCLSGTTDTNPFRSTDIDTTAVSDGTRLPLGSERHLRTT